MSVLIVIPARAGSRRLPRKPLLPIAGHSLLHRTIAHARKGMEAIADSRLVVATDDREIADHAAVVGCDAMITDASIDSGSSRALAAARRCAYRPDIVVNLQGDAPFQPPDAMAGVVRALDAGSGDIATPVTQLNWTDLDALRAHKALSPFSGTTCVRDPDGRAFWFSKTILPAIREEAALRATQSLSPVWRHIGLYAYRLAALEAFAAAPPSALEMLEGLEQLRFFALGLRVQAVAVVPALFDISGIDTQADIARAEALIAQHGDPYAAICAI